MVLDKDQVHRRVNELRDIYLEAYLHSEDHLAAFMKALNEAEAFLTDPAYKDFWVVRYEDGTYQVRGTPTESADSDFIDVPYHTVTTDRCSCSRFYQMRNHAPTRQLITCKHRQVVAIVN